jgi:hypothetical protein
VEEQEETMKNMGQIHPNQTVRMGRVLVENHSEKPVTVYEIDRDELAVGLLRSEGEWRPIETAPKAKGEGFFSRGSRILVTDGKNVWCARWQWSEKYGDGWRLDYTTRRIDGLSHWMPLPEPPEGE